MSDAPIRALRASRGLRALSIPAHRAAKMLVNSRTRAGPCAGATLSPPEDKPAAPTASWHFPPRRAAARPLQSRRRPALRASRGPATRLRRPTLALTPARPCSRRGDPSRSLDCPRSVPTTVPLIAAPPRPPRPAPALPPSSRFPPPTPSPGAHLLLARDWCASARTCNGERRRRASAGSARAPPYGEGATTERADSRPAAAAAR